MTNTFIDRYALSITSDRRLFLHITLQIIAGLFNTEIQYRTSCINHVVLVYKFFFFSIKNIKIFF